MTGDLHIDRRIPASAAELWEACATPRGLEGWCADRVGGTVAPGETLRFEWPGLRASMALEVVECIRQKRVVFRNGESRVSVEVDEGRISLVHRGLDPGDDRDGFDASWRVALALLAHGLGFHGGRRRHAKWFCRSVRANARLAHVYFSDPQGLSAWLAEGPGFGRDGQDYSMRSLAGEPMTGRVLVNGGRDVAFSVRERGNSVVTLRTLPSRASAGERMLAVCWSRWMNPSSTERIHDADTIEFERELEQSVGRLARVLDQSGIA